LHGTTASNGNTKAFLDEPSSLEIITTADFTDHICIAYAHTIKDHRRMTIGVVVREGRVINGRDASSFNGNCE
jgi:hypothetical protein